MKLGEITVRDVMIDDKPIDPEGRERSLFNTLLFLMSVFPHYPNMRIMWENGKRIAVLECPEVKPGIVNLTHNSSAGGPRGRS